MRAVVSLVVLLIAGCATSQMAVPVSMPTPQLAPDEAVGLSPRPPADLDWLMASDPLPDVTPAAASRSIAAANHRAIIRPRGQDFTKAVVVYPYSYGSIYAIDVGYQVLTDLAFSLQEHVIKVKADDWFEVEQKPIGDPPQHHVTIISKLSQREFPEIAKRTFRMTVLTNTGVYYLHLRTHDDPRYAMTGVTWKHPDVPKKTAPALTAGILNVGYTLMSAQSKPPAWTPIGVWDTDSRGQTVIALPPAWKSHDAPVLFILARNGEKHVTNYAARGKENLYVVDRLFDRAELRVGHADSADVITIEKGPQYRAIRCPGSPECPPGAP